MCGVDGACPRLYSMSQLAALPVSSVVVTFACDGNRRKELNMIRHTNGFSWGAAAVGNAKWTGVRLTDLMKDAGIDAHYQSATHPHFALHSYIRDGLTAHSQLL